MHSDQWDVTVTTMVLCQKCPPTVCWPAHGVSTLCPHSAWPPAAPHTSLPENSHAYTDTVCHTYTETVTHILIQSVTHILIQTCTDTVLHKYTDTVHHTYTDTVHCTNTVTHILIQSNAVVMILKTVMHKVQYFSF